jgi:hypothetical protein
MSCTRCNGDLFKAEADRGDRCMPCVFDARFEVANMVNLGSIHNFRLTWRELEQAYARRHRPRREWTATRLDRVLLDRERAA